MLIGINKVGPKLALAILSGLPIEELWTAVSNQDIARLSAIPGVGRKTAERLALELQDKLKAPAQSTPGAKSSEHPLKEDALSALVNLGYKKQDAEVAIKKLFDQDAPQNIEVIIRDSLALLSPEKRK